MQSACICPANPVIGSGRQVVDLLQHVEHDCTEHDYGNDFHDSSPWCAGVARRAS